ncbi:TetR family transcriptional regulator [Longispora fulva]|uniref:AcrR family transcriptional regulator n=1 Tax=Longispora fulva TaxID=619741 RepID=A0A8J7GRJ1_9ACTN|nr:TetR/AcrR family transcriptional regulator [Longispora fulva]MBG6135646.1 AcrR family transcriptional regulator [Longispora fulva]GIG56115.1 TetR family transcriptional regulator [Longispora fulva]
MSPLPNFTRQPSSARGEARRAAILDAAVEILEAEGFAALSTRKIAERARASKETIYHQFGDRHGLLEAIVLREAAATNERVRAALDAPDGAPVRPVLLLAVTGLLTLLTGSRSLALNRTAIAGIPAAPELAELLLAHGRHTTGPLFEALLARAHHEGELRCPDPADAFTILYGLAVRDAQIIGLLTATTWSRAAIEARADAAVELFYRLHTP